MSEYLFYPMHPSPTSVPKWGTEARPLWLSGTTQTSNRNSYLGAYASNGSGGDPMALQGTVAVGGGGTLELVYEMLGQSDVSKLYDFWGLTVLREQERERSAFRISPVHCLWTLAGCPRTFNLINNLWAFADKSLTFEYQGIGACGPLYKTQIGLVSVPEIVSYQ